MGGYPGTHCDIHLCTGWFFVTPCLLLPWRVPVLFHVMAMHGHRHQIRSHWGHVRCEYKINLNKLIGSLICVKQSLILQNLQTCLLFLLQNIKQNGVNDSFETFWPLVLYHVSFFIFITTIGLNIIFGIIVDTFSELRDLKVQNKLCT